MPTEEGLLWDEESLDIFDSKPHTPSNTAEDVFSFSHDFPDFDFGERLHEPPSPLRSQPVWIPDNSRTRIASSPPTRDASPRTRSRLLGGPPSNIYPPPEKIGNLQVPAFTTKINYTEVPLRRTEGRDLPLLERPDL